MSCSAILPLPPSNPAAIGLYGMSLPAGRWPLIVAVMWLGTVPFALLGLAIGFALPPQQAYPATMLSWLVLAVLGDALASLLRMEPDIDVVAEVGSGRDAVAAAEEHKPDVALLDIEMPDGSGLDAAARLRERVPACHVLILTTFGRPGYLRRAMEAGASGFLVKDAPLDDLTAAIRRTLAGEQVIDPAPAASALSAGPDPLTARERDVLAASVGGASVADIAGQLHLSESTVRNYLSSAIGKTGTRNRIDAADVARANGGL